jgi:hypothetical protein
MNAVPLEAEQTPSEMRIADKETALFLVNHSKNEFLRPFMAAEASLSEAAKLLGVGKTKMSYWITRLLEMQLIAVARVEKRGRHQVQIYRSCADVFSIPLEVVPVESDEALLAVHQSGLWPEIHHSVSVAARKYAAGWHVRIFQVNRVLRVDIVPESGDLEDGRIFNTWGTLYLDDAQAKAMRTELGRLLRRYASLSNANSESRSGKPHLVSLVQVEQATP